jgi:hypothetical protein
MVRKSPGLFSSSGDQQEQPFVQVNADRSIWINWQRLAASSIGWRSMLMSFRARIRQMNRLVSGMKYERPSPETLFTQSANDQGWSPGIIGSAAV